MSELAEVQAEIIVAGGRPGLEGDGLTAGRDALFGQSRALGFTGGEVGPVKTGAGKLPGRFGIVGLLLPAALGFDIDAVNPVGSYLGQRKRTW